MFERFLELLARIADALERVAINLGKLAGSVTTTVETPATPSARGRGRPAGTTKEVIEARKQKPAEPPAEDPAFSDEPPAGEPEPEAGGGEDDWPADPPTEEAQPESIDKETMRNKLFDYQKLTSGDAARKFLAANTSNKADSTGKVKPAEYEKVYKATVAAIAKLPKK